MKDFKDRLKNDVDSCCHNISKMQQEIHKCTECIQKMQDSISYEEMLICMYESKILELENS